MKNRPIHTRTTLLLSLLIIYLFCYQNSNAATLNVPSVQYQTVQSAVDAANGGDTIILQAGITFTESVLLKYKPGNDYITIQSSAIANLPNDVTRVNPSYSQFMPKVVPPFNNDPAFYTEITANGPSHHYKLLGIEVALTSATQIGGALIALGSGGSDQNTLAKVAHHFIIDRCYVHGHPDAALQRAIALNSASTNILNSYISDAHMVGIEAQAIIGWNGPGPYVINNNYLEGANQNIMFGGGDAAIPNLVPSDIEFRHNYLFKPVSWYSRNPQWSVKNILELKNARRVLIDGNILENSWAGGQHGEAFVLTVRNQDGANPWAIVEDITITNNIVKRAWHGFNILGKDSGSSSQQSKNWLIKNNLLTEIDPRIWCGPTCSSEGRFIFNIDRVL